MPGDEIIGYTTRGRGITVHRDTCHNIENVHDPERLIKVAWSGISSQRYMAQVAIVALDRVGLLRDLLTKVADEKVNVQDINTTSRPTGAPRPSA